ncbi:hypothetical protein N7490_007551 [Penicillium lividum]|nr:hypothetical protein N7490_007551 [Penicillium lividum]
MGVESKSLEHYSNKVEDEPAPPPAYTPYASGSVDQSTPQESSRSMPQQAEYMYRNSAQPVTQGQPSDPSQWNAPAPYVPPSNYQDQYQNRYQSQYQKYQDRYENGQYQQYQDRYENGQYQKYQDRYENGQYQQYQDQYQNGQYQQYEQKYRDRYQQYLPQNLPPNLPPRPNPPLQRQPTQGLKPCVIPRESTPIGFRTNLTQH